MAAECTTIPVIDYLNFPNESSKLIAASEDWGCFRLLNFHNILPATLMSDMRAVVRSLFDLPEEIKLRNLHVITGTGYVAPTPTSPLFEALRLYDMALPADVERFCSQLDVSPNQRDTIMRYTKAVHELFLSIGNKLLEGLGVKRENAGLENWPCRFRINKYLFTSEHIGTPGVHLHTDSGFLTILQDDGVGGLEVMNKSGEFIPSDPWPDTVLGNLGDMAKVWSHGRFSNAKHRVQCKEAKTRVSITSFLMGPRETVEPPPELVDDDHPRRYVTTTYEDLRKMKFLTKMHTGEALALFHTQSFDR
ncbi:2-oxoglutarate-dependent dioxygenase DAO-like [Bidens hawaiensis]|uniref:2-oxoglutarate-dependent dioxygenase DAO-like n=1 Tax=Bidens hawaiensis TaxID=980011 RepID=UPI00404B3065